MLGRVYTVVIDGVASPAAAFDFFEVNPATSKPIQLLRLQIAQTSEPTTEEEQLHLTIMVGHTTSGSGGSAPTPQRTNRVDTAAGFAAETMNTTLATGGTPETALSTAWNTRAGLDLAFAPEEGIQSINGERLVVRCPSAPADAVTFRATLWVMELA